MMQYKIFFVVIVEILLIFCVHRSQAIEIKNCGSLFSFDNIQVSGCSQDNDTYCPFYIGNTTIISFTLNTGQFDIDAELVNDVAFWTGAKFALKVTPINPCEILTCPLAKNYNATLAAEIYVDTLFEPLNANLRWILKTANWDEQLLCFEFPIQFRR